MNRDKRLVGIVSLADLAIEGSLPKTAKLEMARLAKLEMARLEAS
jgi:hypothetical protein